MRYILDQIRVHDKDEWRVIADTDSPHVWVVRNGKTAYEFENKSAAYLFITNAYRIQKQAEFQNLQPGQVYTFTMADGTTKNMRVETNANNKIELVDEQNNKYIIPHINTNVTPQSTINVPKTNNNITPTMQPQAKKPLSTKMAYEYHDPTVYMTHRCKHDGGFLYRKHPGMEERYCAQCGVVYVATNDDENYRRFYSWRNKEKIIYARDILQQHTILADNEKAEEPTEEGIAESFKEKRHLTPHEIIDEAENLIRNALVRGVRLGATEIAEYMEEYYDNKRQELLDGIALAWKKVLYEEKYSNEEKSNAPQGEYFGPESPIDESAPKPKSDFMQTKRLL